MCQARCEIGDNGANGRLKNVVNMLAMYIGGQIIHLIGGDSVTADHKAVWFRAPPSHTAPPLAAQTALFHPEAAEA